MTQAQGLQRRPESEINAVRAQDCLAVAAVKPVTAGLRAATAEPAFAAP